MYYSIYQLNDTSSAVRKLFLGYEATAKLGGVDLREYHTVYTGWIPDGEPAEVLEKLYIIFNTNPPEGFTGHSMSVSDVVSLEDSGIYFCDNFGFKKLD